MTAGKCQQQFNRPTHPRQRRCYIRTMTARDQLNKKIAGHEPQVAWRQGELIGGKPPIVT
jgi:hypothetical protein